MAQPAWQSRVGHICAVLLGILFLVSGLWKLTDPLGWAQRIVQLQVPAPLATAATLGVGLAETFGAILIFIPRFRRWGAWLIGALLVAFMGHIGWHYQTLIGEECSCFPWIERAVGPGFFIGDAVMLAMAAAAGWWARPSYGHRTAGVLLASVAAVTLGFYGFAVAKQRGIEAPAAVMVDGKPYSLQEGRVFLYFYDPQCMHCFHAAQAMSEMKWRDARVVAVVTREPEYAQNFLNDTGLQAALTYDFDALSQVFRFGDPPYGVLLENGRQVATIIGFDDPEPGQTLRRMGFVE